MNTTTADHARLHNSATAARPTPPGAALPADAPAAARTAFGLLRRLVHGTLTVQLPGGEVHTFGSGSAPHATMRMLSWNVCSAALRSGDIGFAESYIAGEWTTPDLVSLLDVLIMNREQVESVIYGTWLGRLAYRVRHMLNRNTRANSRRNIHAHYDLGNDFYRLWLDPTMNYSSAWFEHGHEDDMVSAQHAKVRRALRMAGVRAGSRVLEIGCGWGALAQMAACEFSAHTVGVTLSTEQLDWARQRLDVAGVSHRAELRLQDYRDIQDGEFDAVCSIEMVEAVGREYWPTYFRTVARALRQGGRACIQSIVIRDDLFARYIGGTDFIQQYVFPGGCLPSPSEFRRQAQAAGLQVVDEFAFGADYGHTLRLWRQAFIERQDRVLALRPRNATSQPFDKAFIRLWEFYLAYCESAFRQRNTDVVQFTLLKP